MEEVYQFLKDCGTYYFATVEGNQPRVRPFGTIHLFENKLYLQTGRKKNVFQQIQENPKVEICAMKENQWIRVSATLVLDERIEAKKDLLDAYPNLRSMYSETDGNTAVFYLQDVTAIISSFVEEPKMISF